MCRVCELSEKGFGVPILKQRCRMSAITGNMEDIQQRIIAENDEDYDGAEMDRWQYCIRTFIGDDWFDSFPIFYCPVCGKPLGNLKKKYSDKDCMNCYNLDVCMTEDGADFMCQTDEKEHFLSNKKVAEMEGKSE